MGAGRRAVAGVSIGLGQSADRGGESGLFVEEKLVLRQMQTREDRRMGGIRVGARAQRGPEVGASLGERGEERSRLPRIAVKAEVIDAHGVESDDDDARGRFEGARKLPRRARVERERSRDAGAKDYSAHGKCSAASSSAL